MERTVALVERRGYAFSAPRLGEVCLGGSISSDRVLAAVAVSPHLTVREGLVVGRGMDSRVGEISARASHHELSAPAYLDMTIRFVEVLVALCPYVRAVAIAGSLASGGFRASDDVDLNLVVEDGHRHVAYVALNLLGILHALPRRSKPVDAHTRRPLAPRLMTANLVLERSQCFPLVRQDEDMAYELLVSRPIFGGEMWGQVVDANPGLTAFFPQLARIVDAEMSAPAHRLPDWLFPAWLDGPARYLGGWGWRYMQWSRRHRPEALARVAYVRQTMRPYALFDRK